MTEPTTKPVADPDAMEVAPGAEHEILEGWIPVLADRGRNPRSTGAGFWISRRRDHHPEDRRAY